MTFGSWEGLTRDEARARDPEAWAQWRSAPHLLKLAGGETIAEVAARVTAGIEALQAAHDGQTVVLVSHGVVARVIVLCAPGLGLGRLWTLHAAPAGITEIEYVAGRAAVRRVNPVAPLVGG